MSTVDLQIGQHPGRPQVFPLTREILVGAGAPRLRRLEVIVHLANSDGSSTPYLVYVYEMSARAKTEFDHAMIDDPERPWEALTEEEKDARLEIRHAEIRERMVIATAGDEQGNRLFTYDDIDELGKRGASIIEPLFEAARKLNQDKGSLEELGKPFARTNASVSL